MERNEVYFSLIICFIAGIIKILWVIIFFGFEIFSSVMVFFEMFLIVFFAHTLFFQLPKKLKGGFFK